MSRQVDKESKILVWVQTGPFVTYGPSGNDVWVIPAGRGRPAPTLCPSKYPRSHGGYGGAKSGVPSRFFPSGVNSLERPSIYPHVSVAQF